MECVPVRFARRAGFLLERVYLPDRKDGGAFRGVQRVGIKAKEGVTSMPA
jgi:hypothetical protein